MLREKKAQIESELNEALANFGPEKFKEITRELQETLHELKITKENLRVSKMAQKQQHKLLLEWKIKVDDIQQRLEEQNENMQQQDETIQRKDREIDDLKGQVSQTEIDLKKQSQHVAHLNDKVNEFMDKYARQAAYIQEQEAKWKVAEARQIVEDSDDEEG